MKEFIIGQNEENKRLDKFLKTVLPKAPDSFIYKMLRKKNIKLNDGKATGAEKLSINDVVRIYFSDETFDSFAASPVAASDNEYTLAYKKLKGITIVYEDDDILVMNKPVNVLSQKSKLDDFSLNEWMIGYLLDKKCISVDSLVTFRPSVLNRLDKNTKGLVIGAKTLRASQQVSAMIKDRSIRKFYRATVLGQVTNGATLEGYLIKDEATNKVSVYKSKPSAPCEYIKTIYKPIEVFEDRTVLEIELITGKSHQIRAHLASIGHPILGDPKYGNKSFNEKYKVHTQDLTAVRIKFPKEGEIESLRGLVVRLD